MFRWPAIFMIIAILAITGFQLYWLKNNYDREKQNLDITTNAAFRQTVIGLHASKLKLDRLDLSFNQPGYPKDTTRRTGKLRIRKSNTDDKEATITMLNILQEQVKDSVFRRIETVHEQVTHLDSVDPAMIREISVIKDKKLPASIVTIDLKNAGDSVLVKNMAGKPKEVFVAGYGRNKPVENILVPRRQAGPDGRNAVFRVLYNMDSLRMKDSVTTREVTEAYAARLKEDKINIQFKVNRLDSTAAEQPNTVAIGFAKPAYFGLTLQNTFKYMFNKLKLPVLFSLFLLGITIISFLLLYRNMIRQRRLAELKNDFISNISHELKTPIATASVAIEALKNFNAIDDTQKTTEYLNISQNELQRLDLLVDKVLKLSIFEKQAIELRKEVFDLRRVAQEILTTLKLQFERYHAHVTMDATGGDFQINADKFHITSVLYNLLDNALKYGGEHPQIQVLIRAEADTVMISIKDNGIGIPQEYKSKVFDKFFRVPTGDRHNIKGYGLGLSYVAEIVKKHHGTIRLESEPGKGSQFIIELPQQA